MSYKEQWSCCQIAAVPGQLMYGIPLTTIKTGATDRLCAKDNVMDTALYCYPTYGEAFEAYHAMVQLLEDAAELGDSLNATWTVLEIRYVSEMRGKDTLFKFTYVPIKASIDMERLGNIRGKIHLFPLIREMQKQVDNAIEHMYAFAAIAEETNGREKRT